ncbi:alpha/beta fold hydrolase [Microbulbifer sp. ARAS458-1]|uniref:alpha/beta fold hydrolase n=1 Tax=Microbulbifer sp. ARAS458-1 TaxID=3140242 RepID=UPI003877B89D
MKPLPWLKLTLSVALTVPLSIPAIAQPAIDPELFRCTPDDPSGSAIFNIFDSGLMESDPGDQIQPDLDVLIPVEDPVEDFELAAHVFIPEGPEPAGGYPLIVMPGGWGQDKNQYDTWAQRLKERGYLVIAYANRGFKSSGGEADVAGAATRMDISRVIDWVEANFPVSKVGIAGTSYGGGLSLLGSIEDPRIEAAASMSGWADLRYDLYPNDTVNCVWGQLLLLSERRIPEVQELWDNIRNHENLDEVDAFLELRSPINRIDELNARKVPTLFAHGYGDYLFKPNRVAELFSKFQGPKKLLLQPGTHGAMEAAPGIGPNAEYIWENAFRWFDHHLLGMDNGVDREKEIVIERRWEDSRPREGYDKLPNRNKKFYLHPRQEDGKGSLSPTRYLGAPDINTFGSGANTIAETGGVPIISEVLEMYGIRSITSLPLDEMSTIRGIQYETTPMDSLLRIRGNPNLKLFVTPRARNIQLHAYLFHVDPEQEGRGFLISHVPVSLHNVTPHVRQKIEVDFFTTSYNVPEGHTVRLAIDTQGLHYERINPLTDGIFFVDIPYRNTRQSVLKIPFVRLGDFVPVFDTNNFLPFFPSRNR